MSRKKIDARIIQLIKKSVRDRHRSMFFILGENYRNQVVILYHLLAKYREASNYKKPAPLWCFKKDLGFNLFHNKKIKKLRKSYTGNYSLNQEDMFEHFLLSSNIQTCHYSETDKILGQTYSLLIIQDFQALTPNTLARIVECVEGGGMIMFLLPNISSLEGIFSLHMDAHSKYVTEAHKDMTPLFNKRFVYSLNSCKSCLVLDHNMKIKFIPEGFDASHSFITEPDCGSTKNEKTEEESLSNFNKILSLCCTYDQTTGLKTLFEALKSQTLSVVSLTSARGRGKSALLGLAIAVSLDMHLSNIYVTSPHLENVQTLFQFLIKGLQVSGYVENRHFKVCHSGSSLINFISGVKVFKEQRQSVIYKSPLEFSKVGDADLVVIDEAAAIPLPVVKKWIGPYNVCMASTINGYEGTGRSLSLKLINQLRNQSMSLATNQKQQGDLGNTKHKLHEIILQQAIRYSDGDCVESWLNDLLCLEATTNSITGGLPAADDCQLFCVNKKALFSYNKHAERFLQQIISLFVTSHYKNTPNDLLMIADAPAHQMFCLLTPVKENSKSLPTVLCVIQVALEGKISVENYNCEQSHGRRASGDLIPWIISQQFQEENFTTLSGARIVRIATHPDCQSMGYGRHALSLLSQFYGASPSKSEKDVKMLNVESSEENPKHPVPPLLFKLSEIQVEALDYVGVSYGLTAELLKFWKKSGFVPLYIRQTTSEVTGEHSCVMLKNLKQVDASNQWLPDFYADFTSRFVSLLPVAFSSFVGSLALNVLHCKNLRPIKGISASEMSWFMGPRHLKRLEAYCNNMIDHHLILDLLPGISKLYFSGHLNGYFLSSVQEVILLCIGSQNKSIEMTATDLNMEVQQAMGCFRKALKKILNCINTICTDSEVPVRNNNCEAINQSKVYKRKSSVHSIENQNHNQIENFSNEVKSKKKKYELA